MCEPGDVEAFACGELADPVLLEFFVEVGLDDRSGLSQPRLVCQRERPGSAPQCLTYRGAGPWR